MKRVTDSGSYQLNSDQSVTSQERQPHLKSYIHAAMGSDLMNLQHIAYHIVRRDIKEYLPTQRQFVASPWVSKYSSACEPTKNGEQVIVIIHVLHHKCDAAVVGEP